MQVSYELIRHLGYVWEVVFCREMEGKDYFLFLN